MSLPDFLLIGAMKCGTSTLAAQLAAQPGVFMATPKEPEFFSEDANHAQGRGWYESLFAAAAPNALKGEASTGYTKLPTHPHVVERIGQLLPAARFVYLVRDPMDRLVSHYMHEWTIGVMDCDLETALRRHPELVEYGCYGRQIQPYLDAFGRDRVLLLTLEEMRRAPQQTLERVGAFLGLAEPPQWQEGLGKVNASADRYRRLPLQGLLIDSPLARTLRRALVPKAVRERIRRTRQITERPRLPSQDRARLEDVFAADGRLLATLFPDNADIAQCYRFGAP